MKKLGIAIRNPYQIFFHIKPISKDNQEIVWTWCLLRISFLGPFFSNQTLVNIDIANIASLLHFYAISFRLMIADCFLLPVPFRSYPSTGSSPRVHSSHFQLSHVSFSSISGIPVYPATKHEPALDSSLLIYFRGKQLSLV